MAIKALSGMAVSAIALLAAGQALAQSRDNYFARDRNVSVMERDRPGYQALGLPLGAFLAFPKVDLGVQGTDNVFAQPNHPSADLVGLISPEIDLASQWSRNSLTMFVRSATRAYDKHPNEDVTDWQLGGKGEADIGETTATFGGDYGYLSNPRSANIGQTTEAQFTTIHPIEDYLSDLKGEVTHTFNRLQLDGTGTYEAYQYLNGKNADGQTVQQNQYDFQRVNLVGKASYALAPEAAVYGAFGYNTLTYPNSDVLPGFTPNPNSSGETYDFGANFDLSRLMRGDVELGYLQQNFAGDRVRGITGFHAVGNIEYYPTQLITLTFSGVHNVQASTVPGSPATVTGTLSGKADYELLRNLILSGQVQWEGDSYDLLDRRDNITELTLNAQYLMNRNIGWRLAYDFLKQASDGRDHGQNFDENRVTLSTTLQY